ncbi:MAG: GAF domain-containing protein [Anaerolineales bacterium]|nr:GAF domain-containing protein [Anaerolineales bacterium]
MGKKLPKHKIPQAQLSSSVNTLELLYNVNRELTAALDLRTVLQRVVTLSMNSIGALSGSIIVLDDSQEPVESAIVIGDRVLDHTTTQLRITFKSGLAGWVARRRESVLIDNTSLDKRWLHRPDDDDTASGPKSVVSVPLQVRGQLLGVMTLVHRTPGHFTRHHLELVQIIADQAGIAILNARLFAESQRRTMVMTALADSAAAITGSLDLEEVLQRILDQISQALCVEVVSLALIDPKQNELVFGASTGEKSQNVVGVRLKMGQGIAGWVATHGEGVVVPDVSTDPRFFPDVDKQTGFMTRAIACAPIYWRDQVIGILEALNPVEGIFAPDALLVLTGIGGLAGTAIRHAQLFESHQSAHKRYRELFEDSIDPILITDWQGDILEANRQAEILSGADAETLYCSQIDTLKVVDFAKVGKSFATLASGDIVSYETNLVSLKGVSVPVHVYVREVDIDGVPHLQWILHDLTERKNLESLRNDLISMIYHDLRSPLANVVSSLDVLETMVPLEDDPALKSLLNIAIRSTERIQRLTNSLLDMRRLEAGHTVGDFQPTPPISLIMEAIDAVLPTSQTKKQEIDLQIPPDLPQVNVDAEMMKRVLINLLENAVKYSPTGSKVILGAELDDTHILIWVQDNGPGIPDADKHRVFDKFTRLHAHSGPHGFGLGLAYCRLAVEANRGQIWVENAPDGGSCFKFTLPVENQT